MASLWWPVWSQSLKPMPRLIPTTMGDMDWGMVWVMEVMVWVWDMDPMVLDILVLDMVVLFMASVRLKQSPRLMLILTTMEDMVWAMEAMVWVGDMDPTVWDTLVLDTVALSMASVRLKLSPRLMLFPTTMEDMA